MIVSAASELEDLGVLFLRAMAAFKEGLHTHGVVFRALGERSHSLAELAAWLGITSQGALKTVSEMIDRGYVERRDDPDEQRVRRLLLTTRGRAALREARRYHARIEQELVTQAGPKAVAATREILMSLAGPTDAAGTSERGSRTL